MTNFPKLHLKVDIDGKTVVDRESHSWVRNHYVHIFCNGASLTNNSASNLYLVDVTGTVVNGTTNYTYHVPSSSYVLGGNSDDTIGIVIGSDDTDEAFTDYSLGAQISDGSGVGQMEYSLMNVPGFSGNKVLSYSRSFTNADTNPISVKEIGLIHKLRSDLTGNDYKYVLMARDVIGIATLNNGQVLNIGYTMTLNYLD